MVKCLIGVAIECCGSSRIMLAWYCRGIWGVGGLLVIEADGRVDRFFREGLGVH